MPSPGEILDKHSRVYVYFNPDVFSGPYTWRLSNIPPLDDPGIENVIENLYGIPPIVNDQIGDIANLKFDISAIAKDINATRATKKTTASIFQLFNNGVPTEHRALYDLERIIGIKPVQSAVQDNDAVVWFDITDLPNIETVRARRKIKATLGVFGYNSRSVSSLTATSPLESVTANGVATISFDITTLPEA